MKTLKNIFLSAAFAAGTLGAFAQKEPAPVNNSAPIDTLKMQNIITVSEPDTTISQSYFVIKDLTLDENRMDKTYMIDANGRPVDKEGRHLPDKIIPYAYFSRFEQAVKGYTIKGVKYPATVLPSKIPGQNLDQIVFDDLWGKDGLYKLGEFTSLPNNNRNSPCPDDCNDALPVNRLEQDLLSYFSGLMNKYNAVCIQSPNMKKAGQPVNIVAALNGLITAEETHILNEKARKVISQYPGKYGLVFGVSELNEGYAFTTKDPKTGKTVRGYKQPENLGYIIGILPPTALEGPVGQEFFKQKDLLQDGNLQDPIIPCDECDDGKTKKSKSKKSDSQTGVYFGLGVGKNNRWDVVVPNVALGAYSGNLGVGINAGFAKGNGVETTIFNGPQGGYPNGLYTKTDVNNQTTLTQFGGELSYRIFDGRLVLYAGAQKNIVNKESTSGTVETRTQDGNNNMNMTRLAMTANMLPAKVTADYVTFNAGLGTKVLKNLDVIVQGKFNSGDLNEVSGGLRLYLPIKTNY